jgi:hypothetical protein
MNVTFQATDKIKVEFEASSQEALFTTIAKLQEILNQTCGKCKKETKLTFQRRTVGEYTYHELRCECGAILSFGKERQSQDLYPRRTEMDGNKPKVDENNKKVYLPDGGWVKWDAASKSYV